MLPSRLQKGDTIGLAAPCWRATEEKFAPIIDALKNMGFRVKCARNLYALGWGYSATPEERASDINELILDDDVKMIFFGGGEGADDVIPLIDYEAAASHPKLWLSYSDGTSILNSIWSRTGLVTYYGQMPGLMPEISDYNRAQFNQHLLALGKEHVPSGPWHTLTAGKASGTLIGGYLDNFIFLLGTNRIPLDAHRRYVLFLEDHEQFFGIEHESILFARLEQMGIMPLVTGVLFGHYSVPTNEQLLERLKRLGEKWNIPVAYCDDFGHGEYHAILPIGAQAELDTQACTIRYTW